MDNPSFVDDNILQWCNGNYELIYSSLLHLRRLSRKTNADVSSEKDSLKFGFLQRFWKRRANKPSSIECDRDPKGFESDYDVPYSNEDDIEHLFDPNAESNVVNDLDSLKKSVIESLKNYNFDRPRLVPKRRHTLTREHLANYINSRFRGLLDNIDKIDEYSRVCNVDQFLCCEMLYEGLFFYGVNGNQATPEFTIIENMLFRQALFQLKIILALFSFVNTANFRLTDNYEANKVFPESLDLLRHFAEKGMVKNLFLLLLSTVKQTHKFYEYKVNYLNYAKGKTSLDNTDRNLLFNEDVDYDLVFRHSAHYLNGLLDVLSTYFMTFHPKDKELEYLMCFLPHVFDLVEIFGISEFNTPLKFLFEDYRADGISGFYPNSLKDAFLWIQPKQFDVSCNANLTAKLCNLLMVMLNKNIYRFDSESRLVRIDDSFYRPLKSDSNRFFYRGVIESNLDSIINYEVEPSERLDFSGSDRLTLSSERFDRKKLRELKGTRDRYSDLELILDFVIYGVYMNDSEKMLEGFSRNVLQSFLNYYDSFHKNKEKFDTNYLQVYSRVVKLIFTLLFTEGDVLSKSWYELLNYEFMCKRKLEELAREPVFDEVNTAIFREPGTTLIHLLKLFANVYCEKDSEFLYKVYKSIAESYNSIMPNRCSLLFTQELKKYNKEYYRIKPKSDEENENKSRGQTSHSHSELLSKSAGDDYKSIKLNRKKLDHLLLFPNLGFSWYDRNSSLLELVSVSCSKTRTFTEPYPRLIIELLEFSVFLSTFPKLAPKLASFLNSGSCKELQFPNMLQRVVTQLRCLIKGDLDLLPKLIYEQIISRDDTIEKAEATMQIVNSWNNVSIAKSLDNLDEEDTSLYLREYFKRPHGLHGNLYNTTGFNLDGFGYNNNLRDQEYLKDVSSYRINPKDVEPKNKLKPKPKSHLKLHTFPLISGPKEVKKALSNLGLGSSLAFGLVEVSSLIFKLISELDPLNSQPTLGDLDPESSDDASDSKGTLKNKLSVNTGDYSYLDLVFSILSNKHVTGTELLIGSILRSVASVHVSDHKLCKMALSKLRHLVKSQHSTLSMRLTRHEFTDFMRCICSILLYLPVNERYTIYGDSDDLLELTKYVLNTLELEVSESRAGSNMVLNESKSACDVEYYKMMDSTFEFLLIVSKGPLGMMNTSRAAQHLYEQILLPGSSIAYILVKCSNEAKLNSALSLVCNVFKRDFIVKTLHKISNYDANNKSGCPKCMFGSDQDTFNGISRSEAPGRFTWFLNKIHFLSRDRADSLRNGARSLGKSGRQDRKKPKEAGCEVCYNLDFNQRPMSILMAHEAFMEALSSYSPDLRCDLVGSICTKNPEFKARTVYILIQFSNRKCKLRLNDELLSKFKCYLYKATFKSGLTLLTGDGSSYGPSPTEDEDFYDVINDMDMDSSDIVLCNKLKFLTQVSQEQTTSFSNMRGLSTWTLKTLVAYLFSIDHEMQLRVVDEKLFLSMVDACKQLWEDDSWHKLYLLAIISELVANSRYSKLLIIRWPTLFNEVESFELDVKSNIVLTCLKLAYQIQIITSYSSVLNHIYDERNKVNSQFVQNKLDSKDIDTLLDYSTEDLAALIDVSSLNYPLMIYNLINSFGNYEMMLYTNLMGRAGKIGVKGLNMLWNYNSYSVNYGEMTTKLLSRHSLRYTRGEYSERTNSNREQRYEDAENYAIIAELYNMSLLAFSVLFKNLINMCDSFNFLKLEGVFDYIESKELSGDLKFMLQLSVVKSLYSHKGFQLLANLIIKLVNHLLDVDKDDDLLRSKVYHLINYLMESASTQDSNGFGKPDSRFRLNTLVSKVLISHLSERKSSESILSLLFRDAIRTPETYPDPEVMGHMVIKDCVYGSNECGITIPPKNDSSDDVELESLTYHRHRCLESIYYSLENNKLNCTFEALKLLSSLVRGLSEFEASRVEFDTGTLTYGLVGSLSLEALKNLVEKRLFPGSDRCNKCKIHPPLCQICTDNIAGTLNVLHSVSNLHQFNSFWFNFRVDGNESLADMFLRCSFLSLFKTRVPIDFLIPSLHVIEHILTTNSNKTRNSIISWLNRHSDALLSHAYSEDLDETTSVYICCLLRVYRTTMLCLLSCYRKMNQYNNNFAMILADLNCKFPLASSLPGVIPNLLKFFSNNLDSELNWLGVLLCLQALFPMLGAFEMDLNFSSQVPIKTKALELFNFLVAVMFNCSDKLLDYIKSYSYYNNQYPEILERFNDADYDKRLMEYSEALDNLSEMLNLKVLTLDCCVVLLEYILSLVRLPNTVGVNQNQLEINNTIPSFVLKINELRKLKATIEKLAKVCTANGGSLDSPDSLRENSVEFLSPNQLEPVASFSKHFVYTQKTLFSTLLTSVLNLDSILHSYT